MTDSPLALVKPPSDPGLGKLRIGAANVRVVIAEAHALVRAGYRLLLECHQGIDVVGDAAHGLAAIELVRRRDPDVVLLDADLPGIECVDAVRLMLSGTDAAVVLLVDSESDERIFAALRAGASGVLVKDAAPGELTHTVVLLARGEALLSPAVARRLIAELASRPQPQCPDSDLLEELTPRERQVVSLVARGLTNDEIAEQLVVTPATAKTHVSRAMLKLGARDRAQLVVFAYETGLA
jgi:DNA-binding NarL/FixJ family response regulator